MRINRQSIAINTLTLFAGTSLARLISAAALILIARKLGVESYGQYVASLAITGLTAVLFSLGMEGLLLHEGGKDPDRLPKMITAGFFVTGVIGALWVFGITWVARALDEQTFSPTLVFLAALSLWLDGISTIAWTAFKSVLKNHMTLMLMAGSQILWLVLVAICYALNVHDPKVYLTVSVIEAVISMLVSTWITIRAFGWHFDFKFVRQTSIASLPFAASIAFATIYGKADVTIVANFLGKIPAGLYGPAISLVSAVVLAPAAIYSVMVPALSKLYATSTQRMDRALKRLMSGSLAAGLVAGIALALIARPLVQLLYGSDFALAGDVLLVLSGVLGLRCVNYGLASILVAVGWQRHRAVMQGISAALNVILNLIVVVQWGIIGVAWVYVLSELALAIGYSALVYIWRQREKQAALQFALVAESLPQK